MKPERSEGFARFPWTARCPCVKGPLKELLSAHVAHPPDVVGIGRFGKRPHLSVPSPAPWDPPHWRSMSFSGLLRNPRAVSGSARPCPTARFQHGFLRRPASAPTVSRSPASAGPVRHVDPIARRVARTRDVPPSRARRLDGELRAPARRFDPRRFCSTDGEGLPCEAPRRPCRRLVANRLGHAPRRDISRPLACSSAGPFHTGGMPAAVTARPMSDARRPCACHENGRFPYGMRPALVGL